MKFPHRIPLQNPLTHNGETLDAVTVNLPCLGDQLALVEFLPEIEGQSEALRTVKHGLFWAGQLTGLGDAVARVRGADMMVLQEAVDTALSCLEIEGDEDAGNAT